MKQVLHFCIATLIIVVSNHVMQMDGGIESAQQSKLHTSSLSSLGPGEACASLVYTALPHLIIF